MDIQKTISEVLGKLQGNEDLLKNFTSDPVKTLEGILGVDLPDEQINAIIAGVKAKLNLDDAAKGASGILGTIKNLFGKK